MKLTHKGNPNVNVTDKWLVPVNTKGNNPKKFLATMKKNKPINNNVPPGVTSPNKSLNSPCSVLATQVHKFSPRDGTTQNPAGTNNTPNPKLPQFKDHPKIPVVGSNTENKFTIIFTREGIGK